VTISVLFMGFVVGVGWFSSMVKPFVGVPAVPAIDGRSELMKTTLVNARALTGPSHPDARHRLTDTGASRP